MPSPTARGETDAEGRYSLTTSEGKPGAVVGMSVVRIETLKLKEGSETEGGGRLAVERVPEKYNVKTTLSFEVPEEGTDKADFDLTTK